MVDAARLRFAQDDNYEWWTLRVSASLRMTTSNERSLVSILPPRANSRSFDYAATLRVSASLRMTISGGHGNRSLHSCDINSLLLLATLTGYFNCKSRYQQFHAFQPLFLRLNNG
jgi:hypothetical protein